MQLGDPHLEGSRSATLGGGGGWNSFLQPSRHFWEGLSAVAVPGRGAGAVQSGRALRAGWEAPWAVLGRWKLEVGALVGLGGPVAGATAGIHVPRKLPGGARNPCRVKEVVVHSDRGLLYPSLGRGLR